MIALGQERRRHGHWVLATEMAERHRGIADADMARDADFWLSVCQMYRGASELALGELEWAKWAFRAAEHQFRLQHHPHGTMVALLAQGRAWQLKPAMSEAKDTYSRCERLCAELEQRTQTAHDFRRRQVYANPRAWLRDAIASIRESEFPRLVREVEVVAGEPAYLLAGDDHCQTTSVFLDGEHLHLLGCENGRAEKMCSLNPYVQYFVAHVQGDSMQGTTNRGRQIDICAGDRLLVRFETGWPDSETLGVFKEADRSPLVKIFRQRPGTKILASANPLYGDRVFDADAPVLCYLGTVIAILKPAD